MRRLVRKLLVVMVVLLAAASGYGQGTTASLTGEVMQDGSPLPGVTVTVTSPTLQGSRTTVTGQAGSYSFSALPPGQYVVSFQMEGMQSLEKRSTLSLATTSRVDAEMKLSAVSEAITVTAASPTVLESTQVASNYTHKQIENLPVGRTVRDITLLAPGVNPNGVNAQITISGAPSSDNTFLVNGVVVNENLRGQPHSLFIEDAIQETTVISAGVSAEYGRFTGGVVSTITKSGGNEFSGSLRDSLTNPDWTGKTPFPNQADPIDKINQVYEGTLGGFILRDRIWFFTAGRMSETSTQRSTGFTNIQFTNGIEEERIEAKLTGQITPKHTLVGSYLDIKLTEINNSFGTILDEASIVPSRSLPNSLIAANYSGILTDSLLVEAQYAEKEFQFVNSGGRFTDPVRGTWVQDLGRGTFFAAPVFCGVCTPEARNNDSWLVKGSYFLSTRGAGSHTLKLGVENFAETRIANNHQSGSDFTITNRGNIIQGNQVFPVFDSRTTIRWQPILANSEGTDYQTGSVFVNDEWVFSRRWSFNVGLRYDKNDGHDADGHTISDDSAFSPRIGAIFDVRGDGRHRVSLNYARYVAKIADGNVGGSGQAAGNPAFLSFLYAGPVINGPGATTLIPTHDALQMLFDWYNSVGGTSNREFLIGTSVPGFAARFDEPIASPSVDEISLGYGVQVSPRAFVQVNLVSRDWTNFYAGTLTTATGKATDPFGNVGDQSVTVNDSDFTERTYRAVQMQGQWRANRLGIGGNYTWSELRGNDEGEGAGTATIRNLPGKLWYPEYRDYDRLRPVGYLDQDQRHRATAWASYDQPTPVGDFNLSLIQRFASGRPYSAVGAIDASGRVATYAGLPANPGYTNSQLGFDHAYFFSDRGEFRLDDVFSTDLALNYTLPLFRVQFFAQGEVLNVLDNDAVEDPRFITTTVSTRRSVASLTAFNPKTETPVEGTHYTLSPNFGQPNSFNAFQQARTYRLSLGFRF